MQDLHTPIVRRAVRALLPALAVLVALASLGSAAASDRLRAQPALVRLDLVDRDAGSTLPVHRGRGQRWVEGTPGRPYGVRLANLTGERVLVVLSVDGINAVSGETANPRQGGYVLGPYESADIGGWRKSLDDVAQFVFTDPGRSYASRTGRPDNIGVVGIAVFRERRPRPAMSEIAAADAAAPTARAMESSSAQRLGTGHGPREYAPVGQTRFERATPAPEQVTQLRYDRHEALVALGVVPAWKKRPDRPQAFPQAFVPDPPRGW